MTESENIRVNIVLKEFNIGLGTLADFLKSKKNATLVYDNSSSNTAIDRQENTLSPSDKLSIKMAPGGGFVARIK